MFHLKARIHVEEYSSICHSASTKTAIGLGSVLGGPSAVKAAPFVLKGVGFTPVGVAAKSLAAIWQAYIGNVVAGSLFSALQSAAVVGFGAVGIVAATVVGATTGGIVGRITAGGVKKNIPVVNLLKTFDKYDSDQDGYVSGELLQNILKDLEITMSDTELGKKFKKATGYDLNLSTPVSYEEFLVLFGNSIFKESLLKNILENLFVRVVKEKGRLNFNDVIEMLEINIPDMEFGKKIKKNRGCDFNLSTPISYEEFLGIFGLKIFKDSELNYILENLFFKVVKEKGRLHLNDVIEMLPVLNVNASEKHVETCFESVLCGEPDNMINLQQFLKIFGILEIKSKL